jgi:hypothetical protein
MVKNEYFEALKQEVKEQEMIFKTKYHGQYHSGKFPLQIGDWEMNLLGYHQIGKNEYNRCVKIHMDTLFPTGKTHFPLDGNRLYRFNYVLHCHEDLKNDECERAGILAMADRITCDALIDLGILKDKKVHEKVYAIRSFIGKPPTEGKVNWCGFFITEFKGRMDSRNDISVQTRNNILRLMVKPTIKDWNATIIPEVWDLL